MRNRPRCWSLLVVLLLAAPSLGRGQEASPSPSPSPAEAESPEIVVTATRVPIPEEESPASISVITSEDLEQKQIRRVADALREVPGLSVVQTGAPGQLTSVFMRGLRSEHTQVLLDGIPINQGLAGLFNFADLTTDNVDRIEIVRGPQSTLVWTARARGSDSDFYETGKRYTDRAVQCGGGILRHVSRVGEQLRFDRAIRLLCRAEPARIRITNVQTISIASAAASRTSAGRLTNNYVSAACLPIHSPTPAIPNTIFDPKPFDNFLTERWLIAPHVDYKPVDWWEHKLIFSYDHERQVNDPNEDGFVGPTRALFKRSTVDYQNNLKPASWLTLTSGFFYSQVDAGQERPFVSKIFGPQPTFISDHTEETAAFLEASVTPIEGLKFVAGGRYDHFNQFGGIWTYRFAGSYMIKPTDTILHSSIATGFSPPSSQDKIFGNNFGLEPEEDRGFDVGIEQRSLEWTRHGRRHLFPQ